MSEETKNAGRRASTYTNCMSFYDENSGALQLGYMNDGASISVAAIFDEQIGKPPQSGVPRYNWDDAGRHFFGFTQLLKLRKSLDALIAGKVDVATQTNAKGDSSFEISRGLYEVDEGIEECFTILLTKAEDPEDESTHKFYSYTVKKVTEVIGVSINSETDEEEEVFDEFSPELDFFKHWLDAAIENSVSGVTHQAKRAGGTGGAGKTVASTKATKLPPRRARGATSVRGKTSSAATTSDAVDNLLDDDDD